MTYVEKLDLSRQRNMLELLDDISNSLLSGINDNVVFLQETTQYQGNVI